ncbi:PEBP-like protein [Viridothelium virens]|uniref:PEBP-like protein n=1 Tax=Viridothelium virens TaxID=1048519 RepID=A0A6A6HBV9_VIRVR|nr:PEBP-like protein [Viridothelium virens]
MPSNTSVKQGLKLIEDDKSKVLGLTVGNRSISTGEFVPKADAQSAPEVSFGVPSQSATYLVVGLDLDAPLPSFGVLGPILHWIQPGFKASPSSNTLASSEPFVANYIGPAPPPFSGPHRYAFFLYEQPEGFSGKKYAPPNGKPLGNMNRMRYDLDAWVKKAGLGEPLAVNYFKSN